MMPNSESETRTIRIVDPRNTALGDGLLWRPVVGSETAGLLESQVPEGARARVQSEAFQILGRCVGPGADGLTRTGLVVGHVQSGKTLSFTTVAALARDNGIQLVVLVAGTNNLLLGQSRARLRRDLRLADANAYERWRRIDVTTSVPVASLSDRLGACFAEWRDETLPQSEKATALVTVLKNWQDLRHLIEALSRISLRDLTALVIDDEADQASLNSRVRQGLESSTYYQLRRLRAALPRHTFLQYTATPQAPLLISIADSLSPDFEFVLEAGSDYVGGKELFFSDSPHVVQLSDDDAASPDGIAPPRGLIRAMLSFAIGAAAARLESPRPTNRSMLIHPSRRIEPHENYRTWVTRIKQGWDSLLSRDDTDPDRAALLEMFELARTDLLRSPQMIPPLSELVPALRTVLRRCQVEVLNADPRGTGIREIPWSDEFAWILIGGQLLDRGFTVEGLTVTYMPRPIGVGNADTLWQRARFCGYRGAYKGFIRVFLDTPTTDAFLAYVRHEEQMRSELVRLVRSGEPLRDWRRRFLLDRQLSATRAQVLRVLPKRVTVNEAWMEQKFPHQVSSPLTDANRLLVKDFCERLDLQPDPGHPNRTPGQKHLVGQIPLRLLFDEFLSRYQLDDEADAMRFSGLDCQLSLYLDGDDVDAEAAHVYVMRRGDQSRRKLTESGAIDELFQGASVEDVRIYRGDREVHRDALTVQIHRLEVHDEHGRSQGSNLPTLAVWVPARMAADVLVQAEEELV